MPRTLFSEKLKTKGVTRPDGYQADSVTPSDATDLINGPCMAIYVTGAGNVSINLASGGTAVLTGLSAGQIVRVNASRILATSTTATGISALYEASADLA